MSAIDESALRTILSVADRIVIQMDPDIEDVVPMVTVEYADGSSAAITEDFITHALQAHLADVRRRIEGGAS